MQTRHVVIAGGGFAGLETAFLLRHRLHDRVRITLVSDDDHFLFRPNTIYIPFGGEPDKLKIDLAKPTHRQHINFIQGRIEDIDTDNRRFTLGDGKHVSYDYAVIATGAAMRPDEVPGLADHGNTIWTPGDMLRLRSQVEQIVERGKAGQSSRVQFLVPPNNKCSGPLYEMVFMLDTWLRRKKVRDHVEITWSTVEGSYIQAFGPRIHEVVESEFGERGVRGERERTVKEVTASEVIFEAGESNPYDFLITFPPYIAAVNYSSLPSDDRGFIQTDLASRQVTGVEHVYAPGDAGDFPVKQAFLAFLQADATAEHIAAQIQHREEPRAPFDPVSMCVMEQFDKAVFAQVPLSLTGDPARPVQVREGADELYKVGVGKLWRLGKKMLGIYLPMRFRAGEPFHAGMAWQLMDIGLHGMSAVFAE